MSKYLRLREEYDRVSSTRIDIKGETRGFGWWSRRLPTVRFPLGSICFSNSYAPWLVRSATGDGISITSYVRSLTDLTFVSNSKQNKTAGLLDIGYGQTTDEIDIVVIAIRPRASDET